MNMVPQEIREAMRTMIAELGSLTGQGDPLKDHFRRLAQDTDSAYGDLNDAALALGGVDATSVQQLVSIADAYTGACLTFYIELTMAVGLVKYFESMGWTLPPDPDDQRAI